MGCGSSSSKQTDPFYGGATRGRTTGMTSYRAVNTSYTSSTLKIRAAPAFYLHDNRNFPDGDPNQGSLKKRLRRQLSNHTKAGTQEELEATLRLCEEFHVPVDELYFKAVRRVEFLRMKNTLRDAFRRRHFSTLRDAISKVENSAYASELGNPLQAAYKLLDQLKHQWNGEPVRHSMGYGTVSEVRRFKSPPGSVVDSVKACYLLVGTQPSKVKTWAMIRALMCRTGQEGILTGMARYDANKVSLQTYKSADTLIRKWSEQEVATVSLEAASFWAWANASLNRKYAQINRKSGK